VDSHNDFERPNTLAEVAGRSDSLAAFGANLRDWQHHVSRGHIHNRKQFHACIAESPRRLRDLFEDGATADAYLAAYAEWLADQAGVARPDWCCDRSRIAGKPWFSTSLRGHLLAVSPASFRQRQLFTVPDAIFTPQAGRPRVSEEQKREKARRRQKRYRQRVSALLHRARNMTE